MHYRPREHESKYDSVIVIQKGNRLRNIRFQAISDDFRKVLLKYVQ